MLRWGDCCWRLDCPDSQLNWTLSSYRLNIPKKNKRRKKLTDYQKQRSDIFFLELHNFPTNPGEAQKEGPRSPWLHGLGNLSFYHKKLLQIFTSLSLKLSIFYLYPTPYVFCLVYLTAVFLLFFSSYSDVFF